MDFERALRQNENDWSSHLGMAHILVRKGEWAAAKAHLEPVLALHGNRAVPNALLGEALAGMGRLEESKAVLESAARMDEGSTAATRGLVGVLARLGEWDDAVKMSGIVRRLDPNDLVTAALLIGRPVAEEKSMD